jgi:hypothetical protein
MYTKFKISNSAMCTYGQTPQTAEHILQNCSEYSTNIILWQTKWPRKTTLETKLYGPLCELQKTVKFIQETTLQIYKIFQANERITQLCLLNISHNA